MARHTIHSLSRKWAFGPVRKGKIAPRTLMLLETVEERLAPATLPTPTVTSPTATTPAYALQQQIPAAANNNTTIDYFNPQVVADPTNPLHQVLVATRYFNDSNGTRLDAVATYSTDGGATWPNPVTTLATRRDPGVAPTGANPAPTFAQTSSPAVAFGRDGTVYYVWLTHTADKGRGAVQFTTAAFGTAPSGSTALYQWYNADQALNPAIGVDNNLAKFTDPTTGTTYTDTLASRRSVYVAWNANSSANPGDVTSPNNVLNFNPNPILAAVSGDGGATWGNPTPVTDGGYLTSPANSRGVAPQLAFSPGNSGAPGSLVFVWPRQVRGQNYAQVVYDATQPDGGSGTNAAAQAYTFAPTGLTPATGRINDASPAVSPATVDTPSVTPNSSPFTVTVPSGYFPAANTTATIQDLSVDLAVVAPFLDQLKIELVAPNGQTLTLLNNRTKGDGGTVTTPPGQAFPTGVPGAGYTPASPRPLDAGLGVQNGVQGTYTTFSDAGARRVNDPASAYPYIGEFRAEDDPGYAKQATPTALFQDFLRRAGFPVGTPISALNGTTWQLRITDTRADRLTLNSNPYTASEYLQSFGLVFSSVPNGFGTDTAIGGAQAAPIGVDYNDAPLTGGTTGAPTYPGTAPTTGVPSTVSVAFDTSLGSYTPFGGSLYVAYTAVTLDTATPQRVTDTNIQIVRGTVASAGVTFGTPVQVNDDRPGDNFTEGNRPQFLPAVAVDATTGTVVATWYDTRLDANETRAATFLAASIDGGATWSNQTVTVSGSADGTQPFLNQPKTAKDLVTGTVYTLQPVPTNVPQANAATSSLTALGVRQSVIAAGGTIYAYWAGNPNTTGLSIQSGRAVTAAGPRVIAGDMGPVLAASTAGGIPYNNTLAADGTRQLDGILVQFDRDVDPVTATNRANYVVRYHNPYLPASTSTVVNDTFIQVELVDQVGGNAFLIRFAAHFEIGTYSYAVLPGVRDRIRRADGTLGNYIDQNADGVANDGNSDTFAMPTPTGSSTGPFNAPYESPTLPLIIPGPHMVGSAVVNSGNSVDTKLVLRCGRRSARGRRTTSRTLAGRTAWRSTRRTRPATPCTPAAAAAGCGRRPTS